MFNPAYCRLTRPARAPPFQQQRLTRPAPGSPAWPAQSLALSPQKAFPRSVAGGALHRGLAQALRTYTRVCCPAGASGLRARYAP